MEQFRLGIEINRHFECSGGAEVRDQRSEIRGQRSEIGGRRSEVGDQRARASDIRPLTSDPPALPAATKQ